MACLSGCRPKSTNRPLIGGIRTAAELPDGEIAVAEKGEETAPQRQRTAVTRYELPAPVAGEIRLERKGYTVSYNTDTRCPNWVAWHLTKNHTYGNSQRSQSMFKEDTSVPRRRATLDDYYNSRYDRGHMCPAGDNKWDDKAMEQTFLLTNICPQNHGLNKYEWNDVEMLCRTWARRYGAVDVVCGPVYYDNVPPRTIGFNKVRVPDAFFKVVLCRQQAGKAIGFLYRNEGKKQPMEDAVYTVDQIEQLTGYDFFPALDDATENRVEANSTLSEW